MGSFWNKGRKVRRQAAIRYMPGSTMDQPTRMTETPGKAGMMGYAASSMRRGKGEDVQVLSTKASLWKKFAIRAQEAIIPLESGVD